MISKKAWLYGTLAAFVILLKLTGVIDWSWWWITAPIWIPFLIAVVLVIVFFVLLRKYNGQL